MLAGLGLYFSASEYQYNLLLCDHLVLIQLCWSQLKIFDCLATNKSGTTAVMYAILLNQVCVPGFLELLLSVNVCMLVCPPPRLLISSDVIWTPFDWSNKFYGFYMAAVVNINSGRGISIYMCHKSKLLLYKPFLHCNSHLRKQL